MGPWPLDPWPMGPWARWPVGPWARVPWARDPWACGLVGPWARGPVGSWAGFFQIFSPPAVGGFLKKFFSACGGLLFLILINPFFSF